MDLISRKAVLEEFRRICNACGKREKYNGIMCRTCGFDDGYAIVQEQEPEEPEERAGKWKTIEGWDGDTIYKCPECGAEFVLIDGTPEDNDYRYCPHCGARLDWSEDGNA